MMAQRENNELHLELLHTQADNEHCKNILSGLNMKL